MKPIVIIGSGLAGYMLAKEFRKLDQTTPLVIITANEGSFYSKPLLSTSLTNKRTPQALALNSAETMRTQLNAEIHIHHYVKHIDPQSKTIICHNQQTTELAIAYDQLILAWGADKISLEIAGAPHQAMCSVNNLEDYHHFWQWLEGKKRIAIIGSGLVGCEFANDLMSAGYQVDMISKSDFPLSNLVPEAIGKNFLQAFQAQGLHWHPDSTPLSIEKTSDSVNQKYRINLSNGTQLETDGILTAIGIKPHLELAQQAGIKTNFGICVDNQLQTNLPSIYALGDCAEVCGHVKQYVAPILQCARSLAKILMGQNETVTYPPMPIVLKTPTCPLVISPPPVGEVNGEWRIEGDHPNSQALFYDKQGKLAGFALTGQFIQKKSQLVAEIPHLLGTPVKVD